MADSNRGRGRKNCGGLGWVDGLIGWMDVDPWMWDGVDGDGGIMFGEVGDSQPCSDRARPGAEGEDSDEEERSKIRLRFLLRWD